MSHLSTEEQELVRLGLRLSPVELSAFEAQLSNNPLDTRLRLPLAAYYSYRNDRPGHLERYLEHLSWLITNAPTCGLLADGLIYLKLTKANLSTIEFGKLWLDHIKNSTSNPKLLHHAAEFFTHFDIETAERLLLLAKSAEPESHLWDVLLTNLRYRRNHSRRYMPQEDLKLRIAKWKGRMEEAISKGDHAQAEAASHCHRQLQQELACVLKGQTAPQPFSIKSPTPSARGSIFAGEPITRCPDTTSL